MHYYIDGYNLLFRLLNASSDLQSQRQHIVKDLSYKIQFLGLDATLVFDAQYYGGEGTKSHFRDMEIIFTSTGETADDYIISRLRYCVKPQHETVITSDKKLAWSARGKFAHSQSVEEFIALLNRRYYNKVQRSTTQKTPSLIKSIVKSTDKVVSGSLDDIKPSIKALPEECQDYYVSIFEKRFAALTQETILLKAAKKDKKSTRKRMSPPKAIEEKSGSDFDRWLSHFEERTKETF